MVLTEISNIMGMERVIPAHAKKLNDADKENSNDLDKENSDAQNDTSKENMVVIENSVNYSVSMKRKVEDMAIADMSKLPNKCWIKKVMRWIPRTQHGGALIIGR